LHGMKVRVLCTGNSARSQMAEGLLREIAGERVEVFSAGSKPSQVNPYAIEALRQRSKQLSEYLNQPFDFVITVCDQTAETCPEKSGRAERVHWSFPDPTAVEGSNSEVLAAVTSVRNGLEEKLTAWMN
jgi:arsenate reductase (thioredoxin)